MATKQEHKQRLKALLALQMECLDLVRTTLQGATLEDVQWLLERLQNLQKAMNRRKVGPGVPEDVPQRIRRIRPKE